MELGWVGGAKFQAIRFCVLGIRLEVVVGLLLLPEVGFDPKQVLLNIGASIIASTILGVPYYNYSITGPKILFLIIKAPVLGLCHCHEHCCNLRSFHQCSLPLLHMFSRCTVGSTVVVVWGEAGVVLLGFMVEWSAMRANRWCCAW